MNTLGPHHWTIKTCFGAFVPVWEHLEPFQYYTKLKAKRDKLVQLMQQFVPRCFVRIFCNECSRSTPLDPKLMFLCVSFPSRAFDTVLLLHETCCKTRQTGAINAKVRGMISCQNCCNERSRSTPLDPNLMFLVCFFPFGCIWDRFSTTQNMQQNVPNWCI